MNRITSYNVCYTKLLRISVPDGEEGKYRYKVEALAVKADGLSVPFYSQTKVELKEQVPQNPEAPRLVDEFVNAFPEPLSFYDSLGSEEAMILWQAPFRITSYNVCYTKLLRALSFRLE